MDDLSPRPDELDPIERASTDELRTLQTERLRWTVRHAYDNVPHYRAAFEAAGNEATTLGRSPEVFAEFVRSENRKWAEIIKLTGVTVNS